jgi:methylated-DNA-[protein]-cysteine S-methyltransferase
MTDATLYTVVPTPIGDLVVRARGGAVAGVHMPEHRRAPVLPEDARRDDAALAEVAAQLRAYMRGELRRFAVPLAASGTAFQHRVWDALREIPYGETAPYGEIARRIGAPAAARAVGLANARNPISIIVPCHRVVGRSGTLTGYAGGLERKRWLLEHERRVGALTG